MYGVYGNSGWYIHGGLLFEEVHYWEGQLLVVPLYSVHYLEHEIHYSIIL